MASIRKVKTGSGATAVQVVRYKNRKVVVEKHVGSTHDTSEIPALIARAETWISNEWQQEKLFPDKKQRMLDLENAHYLGVRYNFAYNVLQAVLKDMGWNALKLPLLNDLVCMRIIEPSSKLRAITLLERYFGVVHAERTVYRTLPKFITHKEKAEKIAVSFAQHMLNLELSLVLYDVTTLYFETFNADELRVPGFSKDNKSQQPQIVVGLLVAQNGFPLGYEVFKGNTFEGHTMIPVLDTFAQTHNVENPVVIADAAMISRENITKLCERKLSYIVGARLGNVSPKVVQEITRTLEKKDGALIRLKTPHGDLVCDFSEKRYNKNKRDMDKQIEKAKALIAKKETGKRAKFVASTEEHEAPILNDALIAKTTALLGVKGYYTNVLEDVLSNKDIVARYHDLWNVEASFRMSKTDLDARPIFHRTEDAVRSHMLVCFIALAVGRYLEQKTKLSLRNIRDMLWSITDVQIQDTVSREVITLRSKVDADVKSLLRVLRVSY
jgi:hypothetical protein